MFKAMAAGPVALLATLHLVACGAAETAPATPRPPEVSVAYPVRKAVAEWDEFTGRFEAAKTVEVRARTSGYLEAAFFREGSYVSKGQLLFALDSRLAAAQLEAARAQLRVSEGDLARAETLLKTGTVSKGAYDNKVAVAEVARALVRAREVELEFTRVLAPISGVVSYRRVDPGNVISGGGQNADVLTTIVSVDPIYFVIYASEAQALRQQRSANGDGELRLRLQDEQEYRWRGRVDFTDNALDPQSGGILLRAVVPNPKGFLKPGMFAHARVRTRATYEALLLPQEAFVSEGPDEFVEVVETDGSVVRQPISMGPLVDGLRVVRSGLAANDRVIVNGLSRVSGSRQKVRARLVWIEAAEAASLTSRSDDREVVQH
jgi:RND family efflux transporter MFP subunit